MSDTCPTVKIIREGQEVVINLMDFDPEKHTLAGDKKSATELPEVPESPDFEDMTATELKEYAAENDIDVTGLRSKVDLLEAVTAAEADSE